MTETVTITGTYRSGTTLVERLVDQHPDAAISSQPLPHLWLRAKKAQLAARGTARDVPLGPLFRDPDHDPEHLRAFLDTWPDDATGTLQDVVATQDGFSGAMTPEVAHLPARVPPRLTPGFAALLAWSYRELAALTGRPGAEVHGAKEIVVDEFVPYLLFAGHHVVLVVRDLRAVVASSLHGDAERFVGSPRPTLFTVRAWRRTVAMALAYRSHPRCHVIRYEDLVDDPGGIARIWDAVGLRGVTPAADPGGLRDQYGRPWRANSSFASGGVTRAARSVDRARHVLGEEMLDYLGAAAGPELVALGYEGQLQPDPERALRSFVEPIHVSRRGMDPQLSTAEESVAEELRRLELLRQDLDAAVAQEWFIHPRAHRALRGAVGQGAHDALG